MALKSASRETRLREEWQKNATTKTSAKDKGIGKAKDKGIGKAKDKGIGKGKGLCTGKTLEKVALD